MKNLQIGEKILGVHCPAFIIAEVGQAHDGSLGMAHAYIDAAANANADAVKFQTHIASEESTLDEQFRVQFSWQDNTRYEYWKRMEFSAEQWAELAAHARKKGICFLSSAFSPAAVVLLDEIGTPAWKVGSGEFKSFELLQTMCQTGKPVLFSTGMSTWDEITAVVDLIGQHGNEFALFQTTSQYPVVARNVGLNVLDELREKYDCPVGLSDHTGNIFAPLAAMARGANMVEVHITFDKGMFGPDVSSSLTMPELKLLTEARDQFQEMDSNPVDKNEIANLLSDMRGLFSKSVAVNKKSKAGDVLTTSLLVTRKPGSGIPGDQIPNLLGKRLINDVSPSRLLQWEDVE